MTNLETKIAESFTTQYEETAAKIEVVDDLIMVFNGRKWYSATLTKRGVKKNSWRTVIYN